MDFIKGREKTGQRPDLSKVAFLLQGALLLLLNFVGISSSASIYGSIYEEGSLQELDNTVVTIEAEDYSYRQVFRETNYSFSLPAGTYDLTVERYEKGSLTHSFSETVQVTSKSSRIDFVLKPLYQIQNQEIFALIGSAIILIVFIILLTSHFLPKKSTPLPEQDIKPQDISPGFQDYNNQKIQIRQTEYRKTKNISDFSEDTQKVIEVLRSNDSRMTQKELRETLNYPEAKMSLIITELENFGFVKKFKTGRENIIKLFSD